MGFTLRSGTGNGKEASVDDNNRLLVNAITENIENHITEYDGKFNISTGTLKLTSANPSAVLYFKNNEVYDYSLGSVIYNLGSSTGGTKEAQCDVYFHVTGGTIVSNATPVDIIANHNLGSSRTLDAHAYKGAQGATYVADEYAISSLIKPGNRAVVSLGQVIIPRGESIVVAITPPAGNTDMDLQVALSGYLNLPEATGGTL